MRIKSVNGYWVLVVSIWLLGLGRGMAADLLDERFKQLDPARWTIEGRGESGVSKGVLRLTGCEAATGEAAWTDYELSFRARAPKTAEQAQLWASVRRTARDSRYAIGIRGGNNNQVYIARYAPKGQQAFLGVKHLETPPRPGEWQHVRITMSGLTIKVFLNHEREPVMEVTDDQLGALTHGGISLGGGFLPTEYDDVRVMPLAPVDPSGFSPGAIKLNFQPDSMEVPEGWTKATGAAYVEKSGMGWSRDLASGERRRNVLLQPTRDSLVSLAREIRGAEFRCKLPNGDYLVTLWVGDPSFPVAGELCFQDDMKASSRVMLGGNQPGTIVKAVKVTDGLLRLTCARTADEGLSLQALIIERRSAVDPERWDRSLVPPAATMADSRVNETKRRRLRAEYRPAKVKILAAPRTEVSLDGKWLFLPDYEFTNGVDYAAPVLDDKGWHVMDVPALWTRLDNWCYKEKEAEGGSDNWVVLERERLARYSFDWKRTRAAWYRHAFEIGEMPAGKRFDLCFEAIAKVAEIWVNGRLVGRNFGMFRPSQFDITPWVKLGRNVIAVHVGSVSPNEVSSDGDKVAAVAVTVAVTQSMLGSIPQGIHNGKPAGIWQPVKLVVRPQTQVKDVFFQPRLDGAKVDLTLENQSDRPCQVLPAFTFTSILPGHEHLGRALAPSSAAAANGVAALPDHGKSIMSRLITLDAHACTNVTIDTGFLEVEPWSPAEPNLYTLCVALQADGQIVDERKLEVGFRTFEARKDGRLYLNGMPYRLRGGNATPMPNCPNDGAMAETFTRIMHEGQVRVTRTHTSPWNDLWLTCADRNGVGVSQEGTWPWLMINGNIPPAELIKCWREEHFALIRKTRNHPSILFWTINNESYYPAVTNPAVTEATMTILSGVIKEMRRLDPTRPICPDSGGVYKMFPPYYAAMEKEKGFDYGDIDDKHDYTGWYHKTFFQHYPGGGYMCGQTGNTPKEKMGYWKTPGRPLISQEMSTGYPNPDDGHVVRPYIFNHMVPQSWVGDYAYEHQDPRHLLASVALNTKELAETVRCYYREDFSGVLHFAYNTWFQNLFEAERIRPYAPALALTKALQPVLVSARLYGRHFYAGARQQVDCFIVNDEEHGRDLGPTRLLWSLEHEGRALATGEQALPAVSYYANHPFRLDLAVPDALPKSRVDAKLVLRLYEGGTLISSNDYDLLLAERNWCRAGRGLAVLEASRASEPLWATLGVTPKWVESSTPEGQAQPLVICSYDWVGDPVKRKGFLDSIAAGRQALLMSPGQNLRPLFPKLAKGYRERAGEVVNMRVPESPVFDGIEPLDLRWFDRGERATPIASHADYILAESPDVEILAKHSLPHAYMRKEDLPVLEGAVIFRLSHGKGSVWVTELAHELGVRDPVAARVLRNLVFALEP